MELTDTCGMSAEAT